MRIADFPALLFLANSLRITDQIALARQLAASDGWCIRFLTPPAWPAALSEKIRAAGFECVPFRKTQATPSAPASRPSGNTASMEAARPAPKGKGPAQILKAWIRRLPPLLRLARALAPALERTTLAQLLLRRRLQRSLEADLESAESLLSRIGPDVLIAAGDRHLDMEAALLKAAKTRGIPIVIPYMVYSDPVSSIQMRKANAYYGNGPFASLYTRWAFRKFSGQSREGLLFYKPFQTAALHAFGALPADPWSMGTGLSDIVCVDNRHTAGRYLRYRVPESKLRVIGDSANDILYHAFTGKNELRSRILDRYGMAPDRKNIIISLPQLGEHDLLPWDRHWQEIDFLVETVSRLGRNLFLSLHPKMDPARYAYLEARFGCRIFQERLSAVLPVADLYVATFSSTVIWSVLCGINTLVVDFYGLKYRMFDFLESVKLVDDKHALPEALRAMLDARIDFTGDWERLSRSETFDGRTIERYGELLHSLNAPKIHASSGSGRASHPPSQGRSPN